MSIQSLVSLIGSILSLKLRFPNEMHVSCLDKLLFVVVSNSTEEQTLESKILEELSSCTRMSEGISMPSRCGRYTKLSLKIFMTILHIFNEILENRTSFVTWYHTTWHENKAALFDKFSKLFLVLDILFIPPQLKELNFGMIKSSFLIPLQCLEHAIKDFIDVLVEVFLSGEEPSRILMRVRDHMEPNVSQRLQIPTFQKSFWRRFFG